MGRRAPLIYDLGRPAHRVRNGHQLTPQHHNFPRSECPDSNSRTVAYHPTFQPKIFINYSDTPRRRIHLSAAAGLQNHFGVPGQDATLASSRHQVLGFHWPLRLPLAAPLHLTDDKPHKHTPQSIVRPAYRASRHSAGAACCIRLLLSLSAYSHRVTSSLPPPQVARSHDLFNVTGVVFTTFGRGYGSARV